MVKVFISCHDYLAARHVASLIWNTPNCQVVSTWHAQSVGHPGFVPDEDKAKRNLPQIDGCDVHILIACVGMTTGGKFIEAGYAMAKGKECLILGRRENGLVKSDLWKQYDTVELLLHHIVALAAK